MNLGFILGDNFGTNPNKISITINGGDCGGVSIVVDHKQVSCNIGSGVGGPYNTSITVDGQTAYGILFHYDGIIPFVHVHSS